MLTYGHLYLWEEMPYQFLCGSHHLVAYNSQLTASCLQFVQHLGDTIVWSCGIQRVQHIVLSEVGKALLKLGVGSTIGHSPFHQQAHPIAHKTPYIVDRVLWHAMLLQGIVHRVGQVLQGVQQSPV